MFKLETHAHTSEVSVCGKRSAKQLVEDYVKAGYSGIVITDHFDPSTFAAKKGLKMSEMAEYYLSGYKAACKAADGRLDVLLGMELRFYEDCNDYLVYGVTEEFIKRNPDMMDMGIKKFSEFAHKNNLKIFQAHPFRNYMSIINPELIDGIEVYNANPRHDSRNDVALMWANRFGLAQSSGSDYHQKEDCARGGIVTKERITDNEKLLAALMGKEKELIQII